MVAGSMLIEVIMGFGIAMIGLTAILRLTNRSVGTSGGAARQSQATRFADEGLDWVKGQQVALGWTAFFEKSSDAGTNYCLNNLDWTAGCAVNTVQQSEFTRSVNMSRETDPTTSKIMVKAIVVVAWSEGGRSGQTNRAFQFIPY